MYVGPVGDSYPVIGKEELEEAKKLMDKDKNLPVNRIVNRVDIPENMTAENYLGMKILPGHRIGWEYKQQHIGILSDLYAEGYLTEAEYDKRVEWVNAAQTSQQIGIAFMDLHSSLTKLRVNEYLKKQPEQVKGLKGHYAFLIAITVLLAAATVISVIQGNLLVASIGLAEYTVIFGSLIIGICKRTGKPNG